MPNKLKDIFSSNMLDIGGKIEFHDNKSYKIFLDALQLVQDEGKAVNIEGISSVSTAVKDGEIEYPISQNIIPTKFIIGPSIEDLTITLETEYGKKTINFKLYQTTHEIVLETDKNEIVYFKFNYNKITSNFTFTYIAQPRHANKINTIVEKFSTAKKLLNILFLVKENKYLSNENAFFKTKDEDTIIQTAMESIMRSELFFKRLYSVEQELDLLISPSQLNDSENDRKELEELYLLLVEKKVIRLNAKLDASQTTEIRMVTEAIKLEVGSKIDITYIGESEYSIYGQNICVHSVNLISNAITKEIKKSENGITELLYGDTDNRPMYLSYTAYKTKDEAKKEMEVIMEHKEKYTDALTLNEQIKMLRANIDSQ
ncbi:MAG: hypothetical protein E7L17_11450 [Clostridium sp.]|uniref:hypothetical protein n=1 Tax=Clostridium sp. TaxID=1506 RepID=UPI0029157C5E|nr:hypothetical protein [Clostridium sp.]MDU7338717.1 hypothetical protein [Clostridium sp.]